MMTPKEEMNMNTISTNIKIRLKLKRQDIRLEVDLIYLGNIL